MKDSAALPCAQIPGSHARVVFAKVVKSGEMALGQVQDVDVIADGGSVVGGIVCAKLCQNSCPIGTTNLGHCCPTVTKDEQLIAFSNRYLSEQGEQVVWNTLWVFTHDSAGVGTGWVEVAEQGRIPMVTRLAFLFEIGALGFNKVGDAGFDGSFGIAIRVCGADGAFFGNRDHVWETGRITIDGGRRGEDDVGDIM